MARTIAIVEDEPLIRANYADLFRRQGFQVIGCADRQQALTAFERALPDLAILDIGLGDEYDGGFELCRELRRRSETLPIIFLTARDSDIDSVTGLRLGADDYLSKDVSLHQLSARVAALFRRVDALAAERRSGEHLETGALTLDSERLEATWRGLPVPFTVTELWILHALVRHPGHVRSREQLMAAADTYVDLASISSHIKRIRRKFEQVDPGFAAIEAVYGAGYRWVGQD
jgi:two-component system OmpR family response regulator